MSRESSENNSIRSLLPWAVAGGALVLYLATLNHWVSTASLPIVAKITGWDWRHVYTSPLYYLFTLPFRLLPPSWQPIGLNIFSAVCAALTLGLLARSIVLLPHDRTRDQRQREPDTHSLLTVRLAWVAPAFAAILCGLQLTFWEHATAATVEMLDLLVFAYVIRCLLEFRISQNENWLSKMALVYGLGITNNWAMIGYFPFVLIALIWIKGLSFFNFRFFMRMLGLGCVGLLLYALLPAVDSFSSNPAGSFWEILKANLRLQKMMTVQNPFATNLRIELFTLSLTSLLPVILIGIRWPSFQGDVSPAAHLLALFMFRFLHVIFLVFTIWVFFDPRFSGRVVGASYIPFLSFYYLTALVTGYLTGYVLLVFGRATGRALQRSKGFLVFGKILVVLVCLAAVGAPLGILWNNWKSIRATNSNELRRFAEAMADELPEKETVVLSDDAYRLFLLQAIYQERGTKRENLLIETSGLPFPVYHRELQLRHKNFTEELLKPEGLPDYINSLDLIAFVERLQKKHRLFYLHPSFGYYFERFYPKPHGLVSELQPYVKGEIAPPALTSEEVAENQRIWNELKKPVIDYLPTIKSSADMMWLGICYSRSLNAWAVELQKLNRLDEAKQQFDDAIKINPENIVSVINQKSNEQLRNGGEVRAVESTQEIDKKLGQYRSWDSALTFNGPFDELGTCFRVGEVFSEGGNIRQATLLFLRVVEFSPNHQDGRISLIANLIAIGFPDKALEQIAILRHQAVKQPLGEERELVVLSLEAKAYANKKDTQVAEELLLVLHSRRPDDERIEGLLIQFYMDLRRYADALEIVERQLKKSPKNTGALLNKGALLIQMKEFKKAVTTMDQFLEILPGTAAALLNRALANLQAENYADAKHDYETLERLFPANFFAIYYGLGEIAYKTNQKDEAIKQYRRYLETAPAGTGEYQMITDRLKELRGDKDKK